MTRSDSRLLDWKTAVRLPWGVVLLLGSGFALAEATTATGLAEWLGARLAWVGAAPPLGRDPRRVACDVLRDRVHEQHRDRDHHAADHGRKRRRRAAAIRAC